MQKQRWTLKNRQIRRSNYITKKVASLGVAISTANIVATNQETNRMDNFAISDLDGKFSIGIKKDVPYTYAALHQNHEVLRYC